MGTVICVCSECSKCTHQDSNGHQVFGRHVSYQTRRDHERRDEKHQLRRPRSATPSRDHHHPYSFEGRSTNANVGSRIGNKIDLVTGEAFRPITSDQTKLNI